jgi:hypothetical protein
MTSRFGIPSKTWKQAKVEAEQALIARAKVRGMMPYSELVKHIQVFPFEAHDTRLFLLLGEISSEEDDAGRGLLTVIVVHKSGDMQPGPGFFELAEERGRDTSDILQCWVAELKKVHAYWAP